MPRLKIAVNARGCNAAASVLFRHRIFAESPRNRFRTAASRLCIAISKTPIRNLAFVPRAPWGMGGLQRIGYDSVGCMLPAASSRGAGVVFGDNRRIGHP